MMAKMLAGAKILYYLRNVIQFSKKAGPRKGKKACHVAITWHAFFLL